MNGRREWRTRSPRGSVIDLGMTRNAKETLRVFSSGAFSEFLTKIQAAIDHLWGINRDCLSIAVNPKFSL